MTLNKNEKLEARNYLKNIRPVEVSICGSPMVPGAVIAMVKSADVDVSARQSKAMTFLHKDEMQKQVYAYVLIPDDPDYEGDVVTKAEVEKACDNFGFALSDKDQKGTGGGLNHQCFEDIAKVAQSCIDVGGSLGKALGFAKAVAGAWLIKLQIVDEKVWNGIMDGTYTGVSMGYLGEREPIAKGNAEKGFVFDMVKKYLKSKGYFAIKAIDFNSSYAMQVFYDECPDMWDSLLSAFWSIMYDEQLTLAQKADAIEQSLKQFAERIRMLLGITEASKGIIEIVNDKGANPSAIEGDMDVQITQEELTKQITDAVKAGMNLMTAEIANLKKEFTTQLSEVKKANEPVKLEETEFGKSLLQKADEQQKVLDELMKRIVPSNVLEKVDSPELKPESVKKAELSEQIKGTPLSARA